ncbi:MAG TPA: glycosyl hydrolase [Chthonomonadaceae bacterium]|nr:glycosyl hydrolase [Chthonomonadaceae bacterium]
MAGVGAADVGWAGVERRAAPIAGRPDARSAPPALTRADAPAAVQALRASEFLGSIGANSALAARGERLEKTIECARYTGIRWFRSGTEGGVSIPDYVRLHKEAGVKFSWSPGSGGADLERLLATGRQIAAAGALLAFEGPNEPNNWGITYGGEKGGRNGSWLPVARLQSDLYRAVKSYPALKRVPVWSITEGGAETDNVGLQFLTIPAGAGAAMPDGTRYADYANVHNYIYHPNSPGLEDNKTWNASDPSPACRVDGLYGEYGRTWARHFAGYSVADLETLPRVTTETGTTIGGAVTEEIHALNLMSLYLDQFKRGWSYTAVYLLRDRVDEGGNQQFGFYRPDYTPRKAAVFLHNLTTVLADGGAVPKPGRLAYAIDGAPPTVHDMLLQKSDGSFDLVVWDERIKGSDEVTVRFGSPAAPKVYDPTVGTDPVRTAARGTSLTLTLSDHPLILALPRAGR